MAIFPSMLYYGNIFDYKHIARNLTFVENIPVFLGKFVVKLVDVKLVTGLNYRIAVAAFRSGLRYRKRIVV